ncbi:MAG: hypothetical protein WCG10_06125, partial [Chlamydiota bacterium]
LAGNAQNAIELKNPDGSSSSNGNAYGITAYVDKLYIVGEDHHGGSTYPCLWISDLAGNAQNAIELKNPDGSSAVSGKAYSIYFPIPLATQLTQAANSFGNLIYLKKSL